MPAAAPLLEIRLGVTGPMVGRGMLAGRGPVREKSDIRGRLPRIVGIAGDHDRRLAATIKEFGSARGISAAQLALAWLHAQSARYGLPIIPIPGMRGCGRLEENLAAAAISLSKCDLAWLLPLAGDVMGDRFNYAALQAQQEETNP